MISDSDGPFQLYSATIGFILTILSYDIVYNIAGVAYDSVYVIKQRYHIRYCSRKKNNTCGEACREEREKQKRIASAWCQPLYIAYHMYLNSNEYCDRDDK
jgi:hypothetical protein